MADSKSVTRIHLEYPVQVRELAYQLKVALWKAGRGPFPGKG